MCNKNLHRQIDVASMGRCVSPTHAIIFLGPTFYTCYIDVKFNLFNNEDQTKKTSGRLNSQHPSTNLTMEIVRNNQQQSVRYLQI